MSIAQGEIPPLASAEETRAALEHAFSYRGDVTIHRHDADPIEGYVFDRHIGDELSDCTVRLLTKHSDDKVTIRFDEIKSLEFSGRDCAAGKSFETWIKKYTDLKRQGLPASQ